jgi:hypothetical protein
MNFNSIAWVNRMMRAMELKRKFWAVKLTTVGERIAGSDEVRDSIPLGSIIKNAAEHKVIRVFGGFFFTRAGSDLEPWSHVWSHKGILAVFRTFRKFRTLFFRKGKQRPVFC